MLKFNNNHIFTGYLKELLASFNLPKFQIYTAKNAAERVGNQEGPNILPTKITPITEEVGGASWVFRYLKDNVVQEYIESDGTYKWKVVDTSFYVGKKDLNNTKNLLIKNNYYDAYTHEYLGDYLRFKRDYEGIDLMPLYNCFSNNTCDNIDLALTLNETSETSTDTKTITAEFYSSDKNYKIYMVPVKLFAKYTIAIDSGLGAEFCCGFYDGKVDSSDAGKAFAKLTYQKFNKLYFSNPVIYTKLADIAKKSNEDPTLVCTALNELINSSTNGYDNLLNKLETLKLFIKLPIQNKSSIVILEGDYTGYNNVLFNFDQKNKKLVDIRINHWITNYELDPIGEDILPPLEYRPFKPITILQLLQANTGVSYPFSDRLIEYLSENVITSSQEEIPDNVKRIQTALRYNGYTGQANGLWDEAIRRNLYDYMSGEVYLEYLDTQKSAYKPAHDIPLSAKHDCLGYCDKDVEKYYKAYKLDTKADRYNPVATISNIDIYGEN